MLSTLTETVRALPTRLPVAVLLGVLAIALLTACGSGTHVPPARGFLGGEIFIIGVPTPPYGPPSPAGIVTVFSPGHPSASEKVVARVPVRAGQRFRIELPAGFYMVAAEVKHRTSCAPSPTSVAPGLTSPVQILVGCDTK